MPEPEKYLPMNRAELIARCEALEAALQEAIDLRESDIDGLDQFTERWRALLVRPAAETPAIDPLLGDIDVFGVRGLTSETKVPACLVRMTATQLRKLLDRAGLSQRAAARELDFNERSMRRYCSGEQPVPKTVEYALLYLSSTSIKEVSK